MTSEDAKHELPYLYIVPQPCGHPLEIRTRKQAKADSFKQLLGSPCYWCGAADQGIEPDQMQDEIKFPAFGGMIIRKCPFSMEMIMELAAMETEALKDYAVE